jgi:hypothetical protein
MVHLGKYGYHPCDWQTYQKLKKINMALTEAIHMKAAWERWYMKEERNRVIRKRIKDSNGQVIGYEDPIPCPEPPLCPVFSTKIVNMSKWDKHHVYHKDPVEVISIELTKLPIYEDYRKARYPSASEESCSLLSINLDLVNELYEKVK